jgi:hypothetical protein
MWPEKSIAVLSLSTKHQNSQQTSKVNKLKYCKCFSDCVYGEDMYFRNMYDYFWKPFVEIGRGEMYAWDNGPNYIYRTIQRSASYVTFHSNFEWCVYKVCSAGVVGVKVVNIGIILSMHLNSSCRQRYNCRSMHVYLIFVGAAKCSSAPFVW